MAPTRTPNDAAASATAWGETVSLAPGETLCNGLSDLTLALALGFASQTSARCAVT